MSTSRDGHIQETKLCGTLLDVLGGSEVLADLHAVPLGTLRLVAGGDFYVGLALGDARGADLEDVAHAVLLDERDADPEVSTLVGFAVRCDLAPGLEGHEVRVARAARGDELVGLLREVLDVLGPADDGDPLALSLELHGVLNGRRVRAAEDRVGCVHRLDGLAVDARRATETQRGVKLVEVGVGDLGDRLSEPEALSQHEALIASEVIHRIYRATPFVESLIFVPYDNLLLRLGHDELLQDRGGVLRLVQEDELGVEHGVGQRPNLEVMVVLEGEPTVGVVDVVPCLAGVLDDVAAVGLVVLDALDGLDVPPVDLLVGGGAEALDGLQGGATDDPRGDHVLAVLVATGGDAQEADGVLARHAVAVEAAEEAGDGSALRADGFVGERVGGHGLGVRVRELLLGVLRGLAVVDEVEALAVGGLCDHLEGGGLAGPCSCLDHEVLAGRESVENLLLLCCRRKLGVGHRHSIQTYATDVKRINERKAAFRCADCCALARPRRSRHAVVYTLDHGHRDGGCVDALRHIGVHVELFDLALCKLFTDLSELLGKARQPLQRCVGLGTPFRDLPLTLHLDQLEHTVDALVGLLDLHLLNHHSDCP